MICSRSCSATSSHPRHSRILARAASSPFLEGTASTTAFRLVRSRSAAVSDLPHEAEEEIRNFDAARRRIAELERQLKGLKDAKPAPHTDQTAIERAVIAAVERERAGWRRKLQQGRARFRRMAAGGGFGRTIIGTT